MPFSASARHASFHLQRARALASHCEIVLADDEQCACWLIVATDAKTTLYLRDASRDAAPRADMADAFLAEVIARHRDAIASQLAKCLEMDRAAIVALDLAIDEAMDLDGARILRDQRESLERSHRQSAARAARILALPAPR
jgi:hypothetical protein